MNYPLQQDGFQMAYHEPMTKPKDFRIEKMLMIETGTYNQQFLRPFKLSLSASSMEKLTDKMKEANSGIIDSSSIMGVSTDLLRPVATPDAVSPIVNGWDTKRIRFMMEISYTVAGWRKTEVVLGYTDYCGVSFQSQAIDPEMNFIANSVVFIREYSITGHNYTSGVQVYGTQHLFQDPNRILKPAQMGNNLNTYLSSIRPYDVMATNSILNNSGYSPEMSLYDERVLMASKVKSGNRNENIASNYLTKVLNSYYGAKARADNGQDCFVVAANYAANDQQGSLFLDKLKTATYREGAVFKMKELRAIDPDVDKKIKVVTMSNAQRAKELHVAGQTSDWHGSDITTTYASILSQSVSAMMAENGITILHIVSTNNTQDGRPKTGVMYANGFGGIDVRHPAQVIQFRFENELVNELTYQNQIAYSFRCHFDLLGESRIAISLEGKPEIEYTIPSFADAMLSPMVAHQYDYTKGLSHSFGIMLDSLDGSLPTSYGLPYSNIDIPENSTFDPTYDSFNKIIRVPQASGSAPQSAPPSPGPIGNTNLPKL